MSEIDILPRDEHNARLLSHVHPPDWTNPTPASRYHLVVIGGGTAGLVSAAGAAGLGARVALIEKELLGGDCLNVGCVPSKGIISAARAWHTAKHSAAFGVPEPTGTGDFRRAMERMRKLRSEIAPNDSAARFTELGVDVFLGSGRFTSDHQIEVDGTQLSTLNFRKAVIATGARAAMLPIAGLAEAAPLTNETVFSLEELPESIVVIGAGPIGCEMAQSFARFGSKVTVLDKGNHILPREDADAAAIVQASMIRDGVNYIPNADIQKVERKSDGRKRLTYMSNGSVHEVTSTEILVGVGRAPNVENLGLETAAVEFNARGVIVDERMRTTNKKIFACGDVASKYQFTHTADAQARIVIQNALFFGRARADKLVVPWCTYTSPEIAHVGMYESDATAAGIEVDTVSIGLEDIDRAILDGQDDGFLRVHLKKGTDTILGATLVAEHAGDMIGELALATTHGIGLGKIATTIHPYPTQGEVIKKAGDAWRRTKLTPFAKKLFDRYFSFLK